MTFSLFLSLSLSTSAESTYEAAPPLYEAAPPELTALHYDEAPPELTGYHGDNDNDDDDKLPPHGGIFRDDGYQAAPPLVS